MSAYTFIGKELSVKISVFMDSHFLFMYIEVSISMSLGDHPMW